MYNALDSTRSDKATQLLACLRRADAVVVASPGYHGSVSGLVKNALDYIEDLRDEPRVYLDNKPMGCIAGAYGWQASVATLDQLRSIGHALRAWPTPFGVAINTADPVWNDRGELIDESVANQLELLAGQLLWLASAEAQVGAPEGVSA